MSTTEHDPHLDKMAKTGCFVSVHVSRPSLRTSLNWKDLGLPELDEALVTPPSTRPPSAAYNAFSLIEGRMRACLKRHSAGSTGGFRFMKFDVLGRFSEEINPLKQAYEDAVEPFLAQYNQSVAEALATWDEKANDIYSSLKDPRVSRDVFCRRISSRLQRAWPDAEKLRSRFSARVQILQFTVPAEGPLETDTTLLEEARQNARATLDSFFIEAQNELRLRALDIVQRMHRTLVEGETVTERSVKPLREFVNQFRELSVVDDGDFQAHLDGLLHTIAKKGGAHGLRSDRRAWAEVQDLLADVAEEGTRLVEEATARRLDLSQRKISI